MYFEIGNLRLFYTDTGGRGVPLLCLPPFPFDHRLWREQRPLTDVARLILPDLRGTGESSITQGPYTMELHAVDMFHVLDDLKIEQAVVMGASMGAYVAFAMYARRPERIKGLIITDSRAEADTPEQAERRRMTVEGLRAEGTGAIVSRVNDLFAATTRAERPALVEEFQKMTAKMDPEGLAQTTLGMAMRADYTELLGEIEVPTLVLCGEEDTVSPPDGMRHMAEQIPGAEEFHIIPAAGHLAPLEQPDVFNGYVRDFLENAIKR